MFLNALCKASVTLISKSNKNITKKLKANIIDDHRCKNPTLCPEELEDYGFL